MKIKPRQKSGNEMFSEIKKTMINLNIIDDENIGTKKSISRNNVKNSKNN
jgi:hypothetical protein